MKNINLSKKAIIAIAIVGILVLVLFVSCATGNKEEKDNSVKLFDLNPPVTSKPLNSDKNNPDSNQSSTTVQPAPFDELAKKELYALPTTGELNPSSPETYVSPRYEAILGGDYSSGIPRSELDNPVNSDLDATTFNVTRSTSIEITKAQITGEGSNKYPSYFNEDNIPGTCTKFETANAGATSLPIPNDNRWIKAIVFWKATCGEGKNSYQVSQQTNVYFTVDNGRLTPRSLEELPRS